MAPSVGASAQVGICSPATSGTAQAEGVEVRGEAGNVIPFGVQHVPEIDFGNITPELAPIVPTHAGATPDGVNAGASVGNALPSCGALAKPEGAGVVPAVGIVTPLAPAMVSLDGVKATAVIGIPLAIGTSPAPYDDSEELALALLMLEAA
jgi:hypothetical protein